MGRMLLLIVMLTAATEPPYSCRLLYDEERKCSMDTHCDRHVIERLRRECLRDGGKP